jgi:hypothetical protein
MLPSPRWDPWKKHAFGPDAFAPALNHTFRFGRKFAQDRCPRHKSYFGKDDDEVLVVQGPSLSFNPTLNVDAIEKARQDDPEAARSEWDAEFRSRDRCITTVAHSAAAHSQLFSLRRPKWRQKRCLHPRDWSRRERRDHRRLFAPQTIAAQPRRRITRILFPDGVTLLTSSTSGTALNSSRKRLISSTIQAKLSSNNLTGRWPRCLLR